KSMFMGRRSTSTDELTSSTESGLDTLAAATPPPPLFTDSPQPLRSTPSWSDDDLSLPPDVTTLFPPLTDSSSTVPKEDDLRHTLKRKKLLLGRLTKGGKGSP